MEANSSAETQSFHPPRLHCEEPLFIPLRLMLQPGTLMVELTRPDMVLGRHSAADVRLAMPDVSRRHCRFYYDAGQWRLQDLKSLNGTFVNNDRVSEVILNQGDEIIVGSLTLTVDFQSEAQEVIRSIADILPPHRKAS